MQLFGRGLNRYETRFEGQEKKMQHGMNRRQRKRQLYKRGIIMCMAVLAIVSVAAGIALIRHANEADQTKRHEDKTAVAQKTEKPLKQADNTAESQAPAPSQDAASTPNTQAVPTAESRTETPSAQPAGVTDPSDNGMRRAQEGDKRYVYLTIDDGPSNNTERILEILRQYNIKATWFVVGKEDEKSIARYKAIAADGHTLAMHCFTHKYGQIYASAQAFEADLTRIQTFLQEKVGYTSTIYRFPGGSSNTTKERQVSMTELVPILQNRGIRYFDWNVDTTDGSGTNLPVDTLIAGTNQFMGKYVYNMVLLHDADDHNTTVDALPQIIQSCLDQGMEFLPITDDTPEIHHNLGW